MAKWRWAGITTLLLLVTGCHNAKELLGQINQTLATTSTQKVSITAKPTQTKKVPAVPHKIKPTLSLRTQLIQLLNAPKLPPDKRLLRLNVVVPKDSDLTMDDEGFTIQALPVASITKVRATLAGIGISTPIVPVGADSNGDLAVPSDGLVVIDFEAPLGANRIVTLTGYNNAMQAVNGSALKGLLDVHQTSVNSSEIQFRTTPTATVLQQLIAYDPLMASLMPVNQLQDFIDTQLTKPVAGSVPMTFQNHPVFVNTQTLYQSIVDLNANQPPGGPVLLPQTPTPEMLDAAHTIQGTLTIGSDYDHVDVTITALDPASNSPGAVLQGPIATPVTLPFTIPGVARNAPGTPWLVKLTGTVSGQKLFSGSMNRMIDLNNTNTVSFTIF